MNFKTATAVTQVCWEMRLSDYHRSRNRALIDSLANGAPPYTDEEASRNAKEINVNDLTLTRITHDARLQLYQAFFKPGDFFRARTDGGAFAKRNERSAKITRRLSKIMRRSLDYFECQRSKFAATVLHGIGPGTWEDADHWCPIPLEISDVLMPSNTLLTMRNLPFFAIWRGYTANELRRLTRRARRDPSKNPGWNMPVVDRAIAWADKETAKLYSGTTWQEYWVPEKSVERIKEDGGIFGSDMAATIACWDFYFWDDANRHEGWRRRIVFDAFGGPGAWDGPQGYGATKTRPGKTLIDEQDMDFLYSSDRRVVADNWREVLHFQFADLSAKSPFKYHSVRSLGFMLYALCHLQNRMNCAFSEAVFEQLMNYLRVNSLDEAERALKIELSNRGIIDESVHFLRPEERWQPNAELVGMGMARIQKTINENSASYMQNRDMSYDRVEKTKFQVMAEVQAMQTLISAGFQQAYIYQNAEYREIMRRFLKKDSADPDVREFRAYCLTNDIPESMLVPQAWDIEAERIMGGGNKTLELAAAQQLMEWRPAFGPDAQQRILKKATLAILDDAAETELLLPSAPAQSASRHDAAVAYGSIMAGAIIVKWPASSNLLETLEVLIGELSISVQTAVKQGGMVSMDKFLGYQNVLDHIGRLTEEVGKDPTIKERVTMLSQTSGNIANEVKAFGQRLQEQMKAGGQAGANGEAEAEKAKAQAAVIQAQVKAELTKQSHAQRTAQRQVQHEMLMEQKQQEHEMRLQQEAQRMQLEQTGRAAETAEALREEAITAAVERELAKRQAEQDAEITRKHAEAEPATTKTE